MSQQGRSGTCFSTLTKVERRAEYEIKAYRHHATAAGSSNEDLCSITLVLVQGPFDHVRNRVAVTTTLMAQSLPAGDVPTCSRMRRAWVDDDEAILLSKSLVRAAIIVLLCSSSAVVNGDNHTGRGSELLRDVDVEGCLGGSIAKRCDLGKRARCWCTLAQHGCCSHRQIARQKCEKTHDAVSMG